MPDPEQFDQDLTRWALRVNLDLVVQFHNTLQGLLSGAVNEAGEAVRQSERETIRRFDQMNAANSLLISLAYVEELLPIVWKRQRHGEPLPSGTSIRRYKPLFQDLGLNLRALACWQVLTDAYAVRHCVLHANGRISYMRDPSVILACVRRHRPDLSERQDRVVVSSGFLRKCVSAIRDFRDLLLDAQFRLESSRVDHA